MPRPVKARRGVPAGAGTAVRPIALGVAVLAAFHAVGWLRFRGWVLDLGSNDWPAPLHLRFLLAWTVLGAVAAVLLAIGFQQVRDPGRQGTGSPGHRRRLPDPAWIAAGTLAALLGPVLVRLLVLHHAPLTDDESAYRFSAQLLASGRLTVPSPPLKLFFDRAFLINDGRMYSQYFLGWPALLVPGVWLGIPGFMNAVYFALGAPAVFLVARRLFGRVAARIALVLYLTSPMLLVAAATELSHTSCITVLAWATWFALRAGRGTSAWADAGLAASLGLAWFIRPTAALGIGAPLGVLWLHSLRAQQPCRGARVAAFLLPALLLAAAFLWVNWAQNGHPLKVSYQRMLEYTRENGHRFSPWDDVRDVRVANFRFGRGPGAVLSHNACALFRLNYALFGWPCSLLFLPFARRGAGLAWQQLAGFFAVHALLRHAGVDSFGPVHYTEAAWPVILLSAAGVCRASIALPDPGSPSRQVRLAGTALCGALVVCAWIGYVPVRWRALGAIASSVNRPLAAVRAAGLSRAVVFAPRPFAPPCGIAPTRHFVYWHPCNDPDLQNDILWVNHIDIESDRRLMQYFPDRAGFVMVWRPRCRVDLLPLAGLRPGAVPRGFIGGSGEGLPPAGRSAGVAE